MSKAIFLTIQLASITTVLLLIISLPLAWWLSQTKNLLKPWIEAVFSLPMVLPPTVLGFYLLVGMGPDSFIGKISETIGLGQLTFSFTGLVIGSVFYSLPFVLQPIQNAFESLGKAPLELALTSGSNYWQAVTKVMLPLIKNSLITAAIMGFAHTVGEFGVVLMLGGNIPGKTKVLSVYLYECVENLKYEEAHQLAFGLLLFSFLLLVIMNYLKQADRLKVKKRTSP